MNPLELIAQLSPAERMDMMLKGYRPGDIKDVKKYRQTQGQALTLKEREERIKVLTGDFSDMGSRGDKEVYFDASRERIPLDEVQKNYASTKKVDYRQQINEEMENSYATSNEKVFNTDDILSFAGGNGVKQQVKQTKNLQMIANEGFNNAKEYLNSFVLNLQNDDPTKSYNLRFTLFKSLKKCLEKEGSYKGESQSLQAYRQGVIKAEKALLEKLQGKG